MTIDLNERVWHTVQSAIEYSGYSERTILDALRDGTLKGTQRVKNGRWRIERADLDAWLRGESR